MINDVSTDVVMQYKKVSEEHPVLNTNNDNSSHGSKENFSFFS